MGGVFAAAGLCAAIIRLAKESKIIRRICLTVIAVGAVQLALLAVLYMLDSKKQLGQLLEHGLQVGLPFLFVRTAITETLGDKEEGIWRLLIAVTFLGHGLYAVGYYETPGSFISMTMAGFGCSEPVAKSILSTAGVLDFVVAGGVIVGRYFPQTDRILLAYAALWGGLTAVARVWSLVHADFFWEGLPQWWFETAVRIVHSIGPLALLVYLYPPAKCLPASAEKQSLAPTTE
jgi:hypothetical protein